MVAIRRRQSRRAVARLGGVTGQAFDVLDVIDGAGPATVGSVAGSATVGSVAGSATVGSVALALGVDQPRASKLVTAAVDAGWVCRRADQADGRRSVLVLTDAGRDAVEQAHRSRRAVFADAMTAWTDEERGEFARLLTRFVAGLPD